MERRRGGDEGDRERGRQCDPDQLQPVSWHKIHVLADKHPLHVQGSEANCWTAGVQKH